MKRSVLLWATLSLSAFAPGAFAQAHGHGHGAKPMDTKQCEEMMASMDKGHMGMDKGHMGMMGGKDMPKECQEMMEKRGMGTHGKMAQKSGQAASHQGTGTVKRVDAAGGKVTLEHDPIQSLGWPKMTMPFKLDDRKALEALKPGQQVSFAFVQKGSDYVITTIK